MRKKSTITNVVFSIPSENEIRQLSVCEVSKPFTKNTSYQDTPYDERMGSIDRNKLCLTCFKDHNSCTGHFGHINLPEPVFNPITFDVVLKILKCVCYKCSRIRIPYYESKLSNESRLSNIIEACKTVEICRFCKEVLPGFSSENCKIYVFYDKEKQRSNEISANECKEIISKINQKDLSILEINKHLIKNNIFKSNIEYLANDDIEHIHEMKMENLIMSVLCVIPPCSRPFVVSEGEKHDDDLTKQYNTIIKCINKIKKCPDTDFINYKSCLENLQIAVWSLIDNQQAKKLISTRRVNSDIIKRLIKKEGLVQQAVGAKRVDFSARNVIGGAGPILKINEIGIPPYIAKTLTIPEVVIPRNKKYLQSFVDDRKANYVIRNKQKINLSIVTKNWSEYYELRIGDIVERHVQTGDYAIFNRQPTLRVESMQGVRLVVVPASDGSDYGPTRVPLFVTKPYNADFDGDEMNIHVPQSIDAQTELRTIMSVKEHIVSGQFSGPICGIVQDGLIAAYRMTASHEKNDNTLVDNIKKNTQVSLETAFDCLTVCDDSVLERFFSEEFVKKVEKEYNINIQNKVKYIPAKVLLSTILPSDFNYKKGNVLIKKGIILKQSGPLTKKDIGASTDSIIHKLWIYYSPEKCQDFASNLQFMTDKWLPTYGFSIGIDDCFVTNIETLQKKMAEIDIIAQQINETIDDYNKRERKIFELVNGAMSLGSKLVNEHMRNGENNGFNIARISGAKGSEVNGSQIVFMLGQQSIDGKRTPPIIDNRTRTLPHFFRDDKGLDSYGFCRNNFYSGLNPFEVYFHAIAGRIGIMSTALRTQDVGYIQKKLARKMDNLKIYPDISVRMSNGRISDYLYGNDGFNPKYLCNVSHANYKSPVDVHYLAQKYQN